MIFHENHLLADNSHEISYLIFSKIKKDVAKLSAAVVIGALREILKITNADMWIIQECVFIWLDFAHDVKPILNSQQC